MSLGIRDMSVLMSRVDKKFMTDCLNLKFYLSAIKTGYKKNKHSAYWKALWVVRF